MFKKEIEVRFTREADLDYKILQKAVLEDIKKGLKNSFNMQLLKSIGRTIINLKINPHYGDHISRKNVSKGLADRYGTDKLYRAELVGFWRLIYTIVGDEVKIISFILEFMDHKKYNKLFGYKQK